MKWPNLNYLEWKDTYSTLHRWLQIMGKLKMCKSPWLNHSWSTALLISPRGFTTGSIPLGDRNLTMEMDLIAGQMLLLDSRGAIEVFSLEGHSVASFYHAFMKSLATLKVETSFLAAPSEMSDRIPFAEDFQHNTFDLQQARNAWQVLVRVDNVFQEYRTQFMGKSSPSHFFWGAFDLALTRFSGRKAPLHPGGIPNLPDDVAQEGYSHEVMSVGFWPGNEMYPEAAFYSYAYPEPEGFAQAGIYPPAAFYHPQLKEFLLPYEAVRSSSEPARTLMHFLESSFEEVARLGKWDLSLLEKSPQLNSLQLKAFQQFGQVNH